MTTSGVTTFSLSRNDIITAAFEDMGVYAPGFELPTAGEIASASNRLNAMIKAWQASGVGLWLNQWLLMPVQGGMPSYNIGPSGDPCSGLMLVQKLAVAASLGDLTITLDDASDVDTGDLIGIVVDDAWVFWTDVNGAPVGNVVTITDTLGADASIGNQVYFFGPTDIAAKPLSINSVSLWKPSGTSITMAGIVTVDTPVETTLTSYSRDEYARITNKMSVGTPTTYYYDPQRDVGVLYVWPIDTDMSHGLLINARMPIEVFVDLDDNPDFPGEWFDALHFNLALRMCAAFKVPPNQYAAIKEMAIVTLQDADGFDREQNVSLFFGVDSN